MAKIIETFGSDYFEMTRALLARFNLASRLNRDAKVLLKPNLVLDLSPREGATTHGEIVAGIASYLQENGIKNITVAEGSWVGADTKKSLAACGYNEILQQYDLRFVDLKKDKTISIETPYRSIEVCRTVTEADYIINLPVLKGHCQTVMTCAIKNLKGCIPDHEKRRFHSEGLFKPIAALGYAITPNLNIVDNICGDLNFEEGGNPVQTDRIFLCEDPVLTDRYGCELMGLNYMQVKYLPLAVEYGLGSAEFSPADIERLSEPKRSDMLVGKKSDFSRLLSNVSEDGACSACFAAVVRALYQKRSTKKICVGQGFRGKIPDGLGVGNCCALAQRSVMGCPPTATDILEML